LHTSFIEHAIAILALRYSSFRTVFIGFSRRALAILAQMSHAPIRMPFAMELFFCGGPLLARFPLHPFGGNGKSSPRHSFSLSLFRGLNVSGKFSVFSPPRWLPSVALAQLPPPGISFIPPYREKSASSPFLLNRKPPSADRLGF